MIVRAVVLISVAYDTADTSETAASLREKLKRSVDRASANGMLRNSSSATFPIDCHIIDSDIDVQTHVEKE